eukprot:Platyproteum_vivax@DN4970_c0_g1_i2.p1
MLKDREFYEIGDYGFLPLPEDVVGRLPPEQFCEWESILDNFCSLLRNPDVFRERIRSIKTKPDLNILSVFERRRAYVVLSMLSSGYVWCDHDNPKTSLPACIALPYYNVASSLGLPTTVTHSSTDLWNWKLKDPSLGFGLDNLELRQSFTNNISETWFHMVPVAIEQRIAPIVLQVFHLPDVLAAPCDEAKLVGFLNAVEACVGDSTKLLERMYEKCDPEHFLHVHRPFMSGFGPTAHPSLVRGLLLEGVPSFDSAGSDGQSGGRYVVCRGASAGQSSSIHLLDVLMGVTHVKQAKTFLQEMRLYMPAPHRQFLEDVENMWPSLPETVRSLGPDSAAFGQFNKCVDALARFRSVHMGLVHAYIIKPKAHMESQCVQRDSVSSHTSSTGSLVLVDKEALSTPSTMAGTPRLDASPTKDPHTEERQEEVQPPISPQKKEEFVVGTGGTDLIPFLKLCQAQTAAANLPS